MEKRGDRRQSLVEAMGQVKIYVEGGGDQKKLKTACRKAFSKFFEKAGFKGHMPKFIACGSRQNAFDDFRTAVNSSPNGDIAFLLVDAESSVNIQYKDIPWSHLKQRDDWDKPDRASDHQAHLMVEVMEAWFIADKETLIDFFGQNFNRNALPKQSDIEAISKNDIFNGLKSATSATQKGIYSKGAHSFTILENIDPQKIFKASPWAERLRKKLAEELLHY
ncbi:DUF4276 family protein [Desulfobacter sp.]|uniref:DUF4276 family protein n=1 Tax=Desulfobacter sp. TaxID=2294 RepID=UPI003D14B182